MSDDKDRYDEAFEELERDFDRLAAEAQRAAEIARKHDPKFQAQIDELIRQQAEHAMVIRQKFRWPAKKPSGG